MRRKSKKFRPGLEKAGPVRPGLEKVGPVHLYFRRGQEDEISGVGVGVQSQLELSLQIMEPEGEQALFLLTKFFYRNKNLPVKTLKNLYS